jgi:hypothetical protein
MMKKSYLCNNMTLYHVFVETAKYFSFRLEFIVFDRLFSNNLRTRSRILIVSFRFLFSFH